MKNYLNRSVILAPYDKSWPQQFKIEKSKILSVIRNKTAMVEHIGSTAIPNLKAKPIIDILIGIQNISGAKVIIHHLELIDYEYISEFEKDFPQRRFLYKGANFQNKDFHIHLVEIGSDFWKDHLFFRDYLRTHPEDCIKYLQIKEKAAKQFSNNVANYCEEKGKLIENILEKSKFH